MDAPAATSAPGQRAFPTHARADRYFPAASIESARVRLEDCLLRGDGPAVAIGAPGVGKTMLLEVSRAALAGRMRIVTLDGAQLCTRRALLQAILFELELPYRSRAEGDLRLSLHQGLQQVRAEHGVALLVDEAQSLPAKLIEELRVLSNLAKHGTPIVRLALFGGPALEDLLVEPEMEVFSQRIAARCYLSPMTYEETREYVRAHAGAVGVAADEVFTNDALDAIFHGADGIPRLVSQLSDRALAVAYRDGHDAVNAQVVQSAWSDLHQLPAPWHTPPVEEHQQAPAVEPAAQAIEFGELDAAYEPAAEAVRVEAPRPVERAAEFIADRALTQVVASVSEQADDTPVETVDPFGDGFEDEEVVIDRFAGLETVFRDATPRVTNGVDPTLSVLAHSYSEVAQAPERVVVGDLAEDLEDNYVDTELDEPEDCQLVESEPADEAARDEDDYSTIQMTNSGEADESEILIIENDLQEIEGTIRPAVRRREYRQLFAQLRRG